MRAMLADTFVELLATNEEVKSGVSKIVDQGDRKAVFCLAKRIGFYLWSFIVFICGIGITLILGKFLK